MPRAARGSRPRPHPWRPAWRSRRRRADHQTSRSAAPPRLRGPARAPPRRPRTARYAALRRPWWRSV
eukprot:scaffold126789_cov69-Phaeocystis_antarctica.AAC.2